MSPLSLPARWGFTDCSRGYFDCAGGAVDIGALTIVERSTRSPRTVTLPPMNVLPGDDRLERDQPQSTTSFAVRISSKSTNTRSYRSGRA
jgi:hypothetical protein